MKKPVTYSASDRNPAQAKAETIKPNNRHLKAALAALTLALLGGSAQASLFDYEAFLSGPNESPANASPGTGFAFVEYNDVAHTLVVDVTFSGLLGTTAASHIHAATTLAGSGTAG